MEKRVVVAIALSLLVLLSWSAFVSKQQPVVNKEVTTPAIATPAPAATKITPPVVTQEENAEPFLKFESKNYSINFIESQAVIEKVLFKAHQDYAFNIYRGFLFGDGQAMFQKSSVSSDEITFIHSDPQMRITKKFTFPNLKNDIWLEIKIKNLTATPVILNEPLVLGYLNFSPRNINSHYEDVIVATQEKTKHLNARKSSDFTNVKFIGIRDRYFCIIVEPEFEKAGAFIRKLDSPDSEIGLRLPSTALAPNKEIVFKFHIYLGPQSLQSINAVKPEWAAIMNYGTFDFIAQLLVQLLEFIYRMVHNWGVAIIILSILVYLILYPLTLKQMRSMKEMQMLQPKIEALRKEYKDNPQKLNKEIMALYKEHKVNPLGGCLPLLLQMPIFFALYQALMRSVALRGAKFLWIKDLSEPDKLFLLPTSLPLLGNEVNLLPILMTIGMFIQQKFTTVSAGGSSAEQQKIMMIVFPLMFGFIFYHMPSGLVLYWFVNSILMLVYQLKISKSK